VSLDLYLDAAATAPLLPAAREAMVAALDTFGDPLSIHEPGRVARASLEDARATVARILGGLDDRANREFLPRNAQQPFAFLADHIADGAQQLR